MQEQDQRLGQNITCSAQDIACSDERRFLLELEFVQCLSNPQYLNWLAQGGFLKDPAFIKYLKYLQYWQQPAYAKYIIYPHCLFFLDCLQNQDFRTAMARNEIKEMVHTQQLLFWQHRSNRQAANADEAQGDTDNVANGQGS